ncbi:flagellar hook-length control protein FliK [Enterobacter sp. Ap-916]|uniref:flagellar hook-length control protein FliK n=1 Tax=Enterobacteriaceae TaxID=543 RepID=UPI001420DB82|nr:MULTISPECIES: flagellar hook-length control protein FliK [unclassified Enterobacter]NIF57411.1 flagellar hook-length control protein FliK [Enterobacter sp. Ap-867]NIG28647.1 flagellar hook-length control protein FliK [Enterobacter sp. Ap-916]
MITLPKILLNTGADTAAAGDAKVADGKGFGEDFLTLLGKALPANVALEDGKSLPLGAALSKVAAANAAKREPQDGQAALAELLNSPEQPEALSTLLTSLGKTETGDKPEAELKDAKTDKPLSDAELQTLSALFAMLPQPVTAAQPAALAKTATDTASLSALTSAAGNTAGKNTADSLLPVGGSAKKTAPAGATLADSKSVAANTPAAAQPQGDDKAQLVASNTPDSRDNAAPQANNTAPVTAQLTPAISSATVATPTTTHIATPTAPMISAQLGSHEWQQQISQHVTLFTRQGQHSAELRLHPEDLGQVQISLKLEDNQAQLQMMSPHSHVRAALEAALPSLRTALAESGIQLGQSNISSESFAQQQSGQQQQQQSTRGGERFSLNGNDVEPLPVADSLQRLASSNGAVDIFA